MKRRNFFGAVGAASLAWVVKPKAEIRHVEFSPPKHPPTIYWMVGHRPVEKFMLMHSDIQDQRGPMESTQIKHGYASQKLDLGGMYLSGSPLENFEPITYWIPGDHA